MSGGTFKGQCGYQMYEAMEATAPSGAMRNRPGSRPYTVQAMRSPGHAQHTLPSLPPSTLLKLCVPSPTCPPQPHPPPTSLTCPPALTLPKSQITHRPVDVRSTFSACTEANRHLLVIYLLSVQETGTRAHIGHGQRKGDAAYTQPMGCISMRTQETEFKTMLAVIRTKHT